MEIIVTNKYLVVPPEINEEAMKDNFIGVSDLADSENMAWAKFLTGGLKKQRYVELGFRVVPVEITINIKG